MTEKALPILDPANQIIITVTLSFPEFISPCIKPVYLFFLEIQPILESCEQSAYTHFLTT